MLHAIQGESLGVTGTLVRRCAFISKVHASPTQARAAPPPTRRSGGERLDVPEHLVKGLRRWRVSILEGGLDSAVQAEGLEFQPEKPETVLIEQDEDTRSAFRAGEAMAGDEACAVETREMRESHQNEPRQHEHTAYGTYTVHSVSALSTAPSHTTAICQ